MGDIHNRAADGAREMAKSGWGVSVKSENLDDWIDALKNFDPWIEVHAEGTVLRSAAFDGLASTELVKDRAIILIEQLNGAMAASRGAKPIQFDGAIIQFTPDGGKHRTINVEAAMLAISGMRADVIHLGPDGKPKPSPPPVASEVQNWINIADKDAWLADALVYFGKATNWFDLYKTLECLIEKFGALGRKFLCAQLG
jgi:hypothetical protein